VTVVDLTSLTNLTTRVSLVAASELVVCDCWCVVSEYFNGCVVTMWWYWRLPYIEIILETVGMDFGLFSHPGERQVKLSRTTKDSLASAVPVKSKSETSQSPF